MSVSFREQLQSTSDYRQRIRDFMQAQDIVEVVTNPCMEAVVPDAGVDPITVKTKHNQFYLHTSPEWPMKVLLTQGSGSIYQMTTVFRDDVVGRWHRKAFTMLEWYQVGIDDVTLIQNCIALFQYLGIEDKPQIHSVFDLFNHQCQIDLKSASIKDLKQYCELNELDFSALLEPDNISSWIDLVWVNIIEPLFAKGLHFVQHFHPSQAALAVTMSSPYPHARRFECYLHGCELANGYWELVDTAELSERFYQYNGKNQIVDAKDIEGMPRCSGVSIGIDRLIALLQGLTKL